MAEALIKPNEVKKLKEGLAACARCQDRIRGLEMMGEAAEDDAKRSAYMRQLISGALDVNEMFLKQQTVDTVQ